MKIYRVEFTSQQERDREWDERKKRKLDVHPYTLAHRIGEFWHMVYGYWYEENEHAATCATLDALAVSLQCAPGISAVLPAPDPVAQGAKEIPGKGRRAVR